MTPEDLPPEFLARLHALTGKRPKAVVDHILAHGFVTTEELKTQYGYNHPPRAARDVREQGIPLETFRVRGTDGRRIAAYRFADPAQVRGDRLSGRRVFSREFKRRLIAAYDGRCAICRTPYEDRYLQIDHRVPYEVAGETPDGERELSAFMLLCGSCNRAKSWSCEHCANWTELKNPALCETCYWATPAAYQHIALQPMRRLDLVWSESEVALYDELQRRARASNEELPDYVKAVLEKHLSSNS
jgi:5-methylcytosine-specific restriction endonuclease McrA